jgi:PAS domain S-box-containing protein
VEDRLREAALAVSGAEGERVYEDLVASLAAILKVEFATIAVYDAPARTQFRTLARFARGRVRDNLSYPIAGTPCEKAMGHAFGYYPRGVRAQFPGDGELQDLGIEGYAATTLNDARGEPIGLVSVMSRGALENEALVEAMLKIFAARIGAEIERRRAEEDLRLQVERLRVSEAQYRAMFDAAVDALVLRDAEYRVVDVNPAFLTRTGFRREEVVGRDQLIVIPGGERERLFELHKRAIAGEQVQFEAPATAADGSAVQVEVRGVPMTHQGKPHVLYVGRDITQRKAREARLRASEEQYRAIFNATTDALVLRDAEFRIVDVNPAFEALSGRRREEVLGSRELTMRVPEKNADRHEVHGRALAGESLHLETEAARKDGQGFLLDVHVVPIAYKGLPHVLYIGRDITERKAQEARLRGSEEQYRAIFDAAADALVLRDADFHIVDVNAAYSAMTGKRREDVVGLETLTFNTGVPEERVRALHRRALAGEPVQFEAPSIRGDGRLADLEVRGVPMQHEGRPHVLYVGRDITERKAAEERLRASEEQYRAIFNATDSPLVLRDAAFRIVDVNPAYEAMSGYSRDEVVGAQGLTFSDSSQLAERRAMHDRALAGEQVDFELEGRSKQGRPFVVEVRLVPIRYRGEPHVLQIGQEMTARRAADAERAQLEAQLRQAQKMEAIGHLTGGIAHDFNNILQGILGNLSLASERQAELHDARLGKYLERAQHSAQRARELIAQMLTFSRGQRGARRAVSLADLVHDASKLLRSTLPSTIELRLSVENAVPVMELDPVQIEQVVLNLCINARDAMRGAGAIRIGLKPAARAKGVCASCRQKVSGSFIELSVRDTGPGIPPNVMERMFEPFFSTKDVGRGSGMGLSLAHGIVHDHGGHILVDSLPNERTKFQVLLPAPEAGAATQPAGPAAGEAAPARARLSGRVLVVDDEQAIREFMADLLGGWGLEVDVLADGAAARDAVAADPQRFDLVITDQTMPHLTGLKLARVLSRLRPGLPVILYTGYAEDLSPQELREAGVLKLVRKPVEPAQFFPILAAHLAAR